MLRSHSQRMGRKTKRRKPHSHRRVRPVNHCIVDTVVMMIDCNYTCLQICTDIVVVGYSCVTYVLIGSYWVIVVHHFHRFIVSHGFPSAFNSFAFRTGPRPREHKEAVANYARGFATSDSCNDFATTGSASWRVPCRSIGLKKR